LANQKIDRVLHNRLKIVLAEKNLQQSDLVELTGLSKSTVSNYCRNAAQPSLETLRMIATVLKVNATRLIVPTPDDDDK